jgi:hypothetical protein
VHLASRVEGSKQNAKHRAGGNTGLLVWLVKFGKDGRTSRGGGWGLVLCGNCDKGCN